MPTEFQKWWVTIENCFSRYMAYKFDFLLTLLAPTLVFCFVNYSVWAAVYRLNSSVSIGGFSENRMLQYQVWAMVVTLLARSHRSWNLSEDIRYGRITSFLLYPFSLWKYHFSEFLAFQSLQIVASSVALVVLSSLEIVPIPSVSHLLAGLSLSILVGVLWFWVEFSLGLLAFWLDEVWVFRVTVQLLAVLCSGAFIPLELFPSAAQTLISLTPFPLLASIPVAILMGGDLHVFWGAVVQTLMWTFVLIMFGSFVWKRGTRLYSAAGM